MPLPKGKERRKALTGGASPGIIGSTGGALGVQAHDAGNGKTKGKTPDAQTQCNPEKRFALRLLVLKRIFAAAGSRLSGVCGRGQERQATPPICPGQGDTLFAESGVHGRLPVRTEKADRTAEPGGAFRSRLHKPAPTRFGENLRRNRQRQYEMEEAEI